MMSFEQSSFSPVLRPPPSQRQRWWTIIGWVAVVVAMVVWAGVNLRFGVSWQDRWVTKAASDQNWDSGDVTLSVTRVWVEKTIPAPNEYSESKTATPGAVWVFVLLDYTLADPTVAVSCSLDLLGNGREWYTTVSSPAPSISDVAPEAQSGCRNQDWEGNVITGGTFGTVFEVPESALGEIWGLRVHANQTPKDIFDITKALKLRSATVILPVTVSA